MTPPFVTAMQLRAALGFTEDEAAQKLGLTGPMIRYIEGGEKHRLAEHYWYGLVALGLLRWAGWRHFRQGFRRRDGLRIALRGGSQAVLFGADGASLMQTDFDSRGPLLRRDVVVLMFQAAEHWPIPWGPPGPADCEGCDHGPSAGYLYCSECNGRGCYRCSHGYVPCPVCSTREARPR